MPVRFDTVFDDLEPPAQLGADGPVRIASGADPRVLLDHGLTRGVRIVARARAARILLGLAAPVDAPVTVSLELRWDDDTDAWTKKEGLDRGRSRLLPWRVATVPGVPLDIKRGRTITGAVVLPAGAVPPGGLLLIDLGGPAPTQPATGLALLTTTITPR